MKGDDHIQPGWPASCDGCEYQPVGALTGYCHKGFRVIRDWYFSERDQCYRIGRIRPYEPCWRGMKE